MILIDPVIQLKNVRKVYRMGDERIVAINDVSLTFEKGKVYCLLGKSGSGKSTLLNLIAGLEKPTKGEIIFNKAHIEKMDEKNLAMFRQKYVGFVFQSYNLLPTLTALENVTLPLIFRKMTKKKRNAHALQMLDMVGLGDRFKHKPSQMSGGQQQRVSIARAFINDPEIIFADEPTGNLDTKTTEEMMSLIIGQTRHKLRTLVIVTHNTELAEYADQVIYIRDGLIENITDNESPKIIEDYSTVIESLNKAHNEKYKQAKKSLLKKKTEKKAEKTQAASNNSKNGETITAEEAPNAQSSVPAEATESQGSQGAVPEIEQAE